MICIIYFDSFLYPWQKMPVSTLQFKAALKRYVSWEGKYKTKSELNWTFWLLSQYFSNSEHLRETSKQNSTFFQLPTWWASTGHNSVHSFWTCFSKITEGIIWYVALPVKTPHPSECPTVTGVQHYTKNISNVWFYENHARLSSQICFDRRKN